MKERNIGWIGPNSRALVATTAVLAASALGYERHIVGVETVQALAPPAANVYRTAPPVTKASEYTRN